VQEAALRPPNVSQVGRADLARETMVKPIDAWWTVLFVDPIATRTVPPLARLRWVTPTRVTLLAHLLGVVAVVLFADGHLLLAGVAFEVRFVLDCVDGKLARATGRSSRLGQLLDAFGDQVLTVACVAALGWARSPAAVAVVAACYSLSFQLMGTRGDLLRELGARKPSARAAERGWGAAMARRRLLPIPTSVEVEHLLLVGAPVLWALGWDVVEPALWATAGYFVLQVARYGAGILRAAAALDRAAP
jgi:phosphatidylglycerophosphate synthase